VEFEELAECDWAFIRHQGGGSVQEELMRSFREHDLGSPRTLMESDSAPFVYATVAQTDALCLRPIPLGRRLPSIGGLVEVPLAPIFPRTTRGLTFRDPGGLTSADRAMVRVLKEVTADFQSNAAPRADADPPLQLIGR
jgi:DNA-binding transcriptional LysR family regulator